MTPIEFDDYLSWPRDRHNFSREAEPSGVGTRVGPSGAAVDEDPNQVHTTRKTRITYGSKSVCKINITYGLYPYVNFGTKI